MSVETASFTVPVTPGEWPEQRVGLFIDIQNLYYAARDHANKHVDYRALMQLALRGRKLAQATAYVVERDGEANAYGFVTKLSALGYRVRRRTVRYVSSDTHSQAIPEGDWDLGIAADMVRSWEYLDVLVLASGDGDFVPMLELAQERACRVEVLAFKQSSSQALMDCADRFTNLADVDHIFIQT